ncbi:MAG: hypothetical protein E6G18_05525 [Actinobacteria bacterium]|nr:MAG: hypothetical protein E6G18_05525 [Actinomycetota bacterium]
MTDTSCGSLFTSYPTWGLVFPRPVLHEPGPLHMTVFADPAGRPVRVGDTLRLTATYDNSRPHVRVMGIMILYLAPGPAGFASPSMRRGTFSYRFTRPGTYRLFFSLHPARMTQLVVVR